MNAFCLPGTVFCSFCVVGEADIQKPALSRTLGTVAEGHRRQKEHSPGGRPPGFSAKVFGGAMEEEVPAAWGNPDRLSEAPAFAGTLRSRSLDNKGAPWRLRGTEGPCAQCFCSAGQGPCGEV